MAILEETLRSIVLSPISTTRPPTISGLTWKYQGLAIHALNCGRESVRPEGRETYLVGNLELLASTDVLGLADGGLETVNGLVVEGLFQFHVKPVDQHHVPVLVLYAPFHRI